MSGGGVYVYRTRKPCSVIALLRIPARLVVPGAAAACLAAWQTGAPWWIGLPVLLLTGRHFAYVGETVNFTARHNEHMSGGGRWSKGAAPWSDLGAVRVACIPLPRWKWLLRAVETVLIFALCPVYNHKKNLWNPRRIPLAQSRRMRKRRDGRYLKINAPRADVLHIVIIVIAAIVAGSWLS